MRNKKILFIGILLFMVVLSIGAISAENVDGAIASNGTIAIPEDTEPVSGGVDFVTENPWNTTGELSYEIPSDAKTIKSADVYVNVYGGSANNDRGANANITITTDNDVEKHYELLWTEDGSSDGTVYIVNDHTTKCYSDYMIHYDITDMVNGLNGTELKINVDTYEMEGKIFDGRIKLIALILAYDDGDTDSISYWINDDQLWTKTNTTVTFNTDINLFTDATLRNVVLSSGDGTYMLNGELLGDAAIHESGNYYQYNEWDVTNEIKTNQQTDLDVMYAGTSAYGSIKNVLSVLTVNNYVPKNYEPVSGGVDVETENPWNTTGELIYEIPSNAKTIKNAEVYVNVYGGSANTDRGANANITITTSNKNKKYTESLWTADGSSDGTVYIVNGHTTKCYSDYMIHYDITDMVNGLNGTELKINVDTYEMEGKIFDGRIKLIALILAYDDGDTDSISYWINDDQLWTKTNTTVTFNTDNLTNFERATLRNVVLSSGDGTYMLNGELLGDAAIHESGNYYQYNEWDVSNETKPKQQTNLDVIYAGTSAWGSIKNVLSVLTVYQPKIGTIISADDITVKFKDTTKKLVVNITDFDGTPLAVNLTVNLNGKTFTVQSDENGQATIPIGVLTPKTYVATISYNGDDTYDVSNTTAKVVVTKANTVINAPDVTVTYRNTTGELVATITNEYGKPLAVNLDVNFNGENYTLKTDSQGQISIPIGVLTPGTYAATISYAGNVNYNPTSTTTQIIVTKADTKITAPNVSVNFSDPNGKLVATITNEYGKALAVYVNVTLNGETYAIKANSKGQVIIPTKDLTPKKYTVTISYKGNVNYNPSSVTAKITVTKADTVMTAPDVSVNFSNPDGKLIATLTNAYGKPLAVYVNVTLNSETYAVRADSKGQVIIPTKDLTPKTYTATISYKGNGNYKASSATAKITVTKADSVITAPDVSVAYKNPTNKTIATITNPYGKALAVYVNVTVNGEKFVVRANYRGQVSISTANLAPGTYNATISYRGNGNYNPSTATTQITVEKADTVISAPDISVAYKDVNGQLVATLTNAYGKPLSVYVTVNLNGKAYDVRADSNGQIIIPTKTLSPGNYTATITYKGNGNYNPTSTTAQITVNKADTVITAQSVTVDCGDPDGKLVATLTNAYGKALSVYVTVNLNGENYDVRADSNGQIIIPTKDLAAGTYQATITYKGNGNYNPTTTTAQIKVKN